MPEIMRPLPPQLTPAAGAPRGVYLGLSYTFNLTGFGFLSLGCSMVHRHRNGADRDEPNRRRTLWWVFLVFSIATSWWRLIATKVTQRLG